MTTRAERGEGADVPIAPQVCTAPANLTHFNVANLRLFFSFFHFLNVNDIQTFAKHISVEYYGAKDIFIARVILNISKKPFTDPLLLKDVLIDSATTKFEEMFYLNQSQFVIHSTLKYPIEGYDVKSETTCLRETEEKAINLEAEKETGEKTVTYLEN